MLHSIDSEILFLKQEDVIKAGLLDMKQILKVTEKTYELMGQGLIKNPPKVRTRRTGSRSSTPCPATSAAM